MPRQDFQIEISGSTVYIDSDGTSFTGSGVVKSASEFTIGVSRRKPTGWIPPTNYSFRRDRYDALTGTYTYKRFNEDGVNDQTRKLIGHPFASDISSINDRNLFDGTYVLPEQFPQYLIDQALIKARIKMKRPTINLGIAFGERAKTARLVGDTALKIVESIRELRRGHFRDAAEALGIRNPPRRPRGSNVPNQWLELQYGWKPLLQDVHGAVRALSAQPPENWIVTGEGKSIDKVDVTRDFSGHGVAQPVIGFAEGMQGCFVRIDAIPENDLLQSFASLGLTNPALIAWELVPFSFVADWFLPIGPYLESLDAMLGYGPTWCSISTLQKVTWKLKGSSSSESGGGGYTYTGDVAGHGQKTAVRLIRAASDEVPLPSMPRLKDPRSLAHMANALSLLVAVVGGQR